MSSEYLVGKMAVLEGLVTEEQVVECMELLAQRPHLSLGQIFVEKEYLTSEQLKKLITRQRQALRRQQTKSDAPPEPGLFGQVALRLGYVTQADLQHALRIQLDDPEHKRRLGEVLVELGALTIEQVKEILERQDKVGVACTRCRAEYNFPKDKIRTLEQVACFRCGGKLAVSQAPRAVFTEEMKTMVVEPPGKKKKSADDTSFTVQAPAEGDDTDPDDPFGAIVDIKNSVIGDYHILDKLGEGGMGAVYKALHTTIKREVALKIMPKAIDPDDVRIRRFFTEAESLGRLAHPNIVQIFNVGQIESYYFIEMELVDGGDLRNLIHEKQAFSVEEALPIMKEICRGVALAHEKEIVHRDIKPANVLLTRDGQCKIADFGIAKDLAVQSHLTHDGALMGTPDYMSPEQCRGLAVTLASDVYSLGAVFYHMLTGKRPFTAKDPMMIVLQHMNKEVVPPRRHAPDLPVSYSNIVERMLAKNPKERYGDAGEVLEVIEQVEKGAEIAYTARRVRRRRLWLSLASLVLALLCAGFFFGAREYLAWLEKEKEGTGVQALLREGETKYLARDFDGAVEALRTALTRREIPDARTLVVRAEKLGKVQVLLKSGHLGDAERSLEDYGKVHSLDEPVRVLKGLLQRLRKTEGLLERGEFKAARTETQGLLKAGEDLPRVSVLDEALGLLLKALEYETRGEPDQALAAAHRAVQISKQDPRIVAEETRIISGMLAMLRAAVNEKNLEKAGQLAAAVLAVLPLHEEARRLQTEVERSRQALEDLLRTGRENLRAGKFQDALRRFTEARSLRPGSDLDGLIRKAQYGLHISRAEEARLDKRFDEALAEYEKALAFAPEGHDLDQRKQRCHEERYRFLLGRAQSLFRAGERPKARAFLQEALGLVSSPLEARDLLAEIERIDATPKGMVYVPGGTYALGRKGDRDAPERSARLRPFYIGRTEVTNAAFKEFVDAGGYGRENLWEARAWKKIDTFRSRAGEEHGPGHWQKGTFREGTGDHPVTHVSWFEAAAYARWRGMRLPTEEEWEVAAGFHPETGGMRDYPWGSEWDETRGNFHRKGVELLLAPAGFSEGDRSPLGCLHMAGNTAEWTASWWDPAKKNNRIVKGTSVFLTGAESHGRASHRFRCPPLITRVRIVGFRLAQSAE
jgi:formylglycine-generating enzyme required for sulfatase activity/tRNA A-37 threonylcarbamoyl transferase component Bud32